MHTWTQDDADTSRYRSLTHKIRTWFPDIEDVATSEMEVEFHYTDDSFDYEYGSISATHECYSVEVVAEEDGTVTSHIVLKRPFDDGEAESYTTEEWEDVTIEDGNEDGPEHDKAATYAVSEVVLVGVEEEVVHANYRNVHGLNVEEPVTVYVATYTSRLTLR